MATRPDPTSSYPTCSIPLRQYGSAKHAGGLRTPEKFEKTVEQGASTSVLLEASPLVEGIGERYFENNDEADVVAERSPSLGRSGGVANYALDADNASRLWREATALTAGQ